MKRKNLTSLEIKEIDLSLSEDYKAYIEWHEFLRENLNKLLGIPRELSFNPVEVQPPQITL